MLSSASQDAKIEDGSLLICCGSVTVLRAESFANAFGPIVLTESGIETVSSAVQYENACSPTDVNVFGK